MCTQVNINGNRELACTVGDLMPGQRYRTPEGKECMVTDGNPAPVVVDLQTGVIVHVPSEIKLGRDRQGRLYASRFLNDPNCIAQREANVKAIMDLLP